MYGFLLLGAAAAIYMYGFANSGIAVQNLTAKPTGLSLVKQSGFFENLKPKFNLTMQITNPNTKTLTFQEFYGDLYYNGKRISTAQAKKAIKLPAQDTSVLRDIIMQVNALDITNNFLTVLIDKKTKPMNLKGYVVADGFKYFFDYPINLKTT